MEMTTTPRTSSQPGDDGLPEHGGGGPNWTTAIGVIVAFGILGAVGYALVGGFSAASEIEGQASSEPEVVETDPTTPAASTVDETATSSDTLATSTAINDAASEESFVGPDGEVLTLGDLPGYVTEPMVYEPGTPEGDVEVAYINSEIATTRALAMPELVESEGSFWSVGYNLQGREDLRQILLDEGWRTVPGELSQIEIENIRIVEGDVAEVEVCSLDDSITFSALDPAIEPAKALTTVHAVMRMVRGSEGQWQTSEQVSLLSEIEGVGDCLDIEVVRLEEGEDSG